MASGKGKRENLKLKASEEFLRDIPFGTVYVPYPAPARAPASSGRAPSPSAAPPPVAEFSTASLSHLLLPERRVRRALEAPASVPHMVPPVDYSAAFLDERELPFFRALGAPPPGGGGLLHPALRDSESARRAANEAFLQAHPWLAQAGAAAGEGGVSSGGGGSADGGGSAAAGVGAGAGGGMTYTKLVALKTTALELWWSRGWDLSTAALGVASFERALLLGRVGKANRKLTMAACLLLAWKMNESEGGGGEDEGEDGGDGDAGAGGGGGGSGGGGWGGASGAEEDAEKRKAAAAARRAREVVGALASAFNTKRAAILAEEFPVFMALRFALHVESESVLPHRDRLLAAKGAQLAAYLKAPARR
jgi:hypothetical protein